jgi:hypothetical protein
MQSFNTDTLLATNRFNLKQDKVYSYLQKYREQNISTYSELIWPMPNETYDTLKIGIQKLIDLGQKDFLMVHPLVLTYNATMGQPWYMEKHGLKYETVPLDTFYLSVEDLENYIIEHTWGVKATSTASEEEVFKGHSFSHLLIVLYYLIYIVDINFIHFWEKWSKTSGVEFFVIYSGFCSTFLKSGILLHFSQKWNFAPHFSKVEFCSTFPKSGILLHFSQKWNFAPLFPKVEFCSTFLKSGFLALPFLKR